MNLMNQEELEYEVKKLLELALQVRVIAYCPYSGYKVGAALLDTKGNYHTGCNIESSDYTLTTHAEMLAIDSMVKSGFKEISKILIVLEGDEKPATPCGLCRQKMSEFSKKNISIYSVNLNKAGNINKIYHFTLDELLPYRFDSSFLGK